MFSLLFPHSLSRLWRNHDEHCNGHPATFLRSFRLCAKAPLSYGLRQKRKNIISPMYQNMLPLKESKKIIVLHKRFKQWFAHEVNKPLGFVYHKFSAEFRHVYLTLKRHYHSPGLYITQYLLRFFSNSCRILICLLTFWILIFFNLVDKKGFGLRTELEIWRPRATDLPSSKMYKI